MMALQLDEQRCEQCEKLLFRGVIGIGFIEVKCARCGHLNLLNSYEAMLHGKPGAYILVYDHTGTIVAASTSAEDILGYSGPELTDMSIKKLGATCTLPDFRSDDTIEALEAWEDFHATLPPIVHQRCKDGTIVDADARYYPIGTVSGVYTIGIFYAHSFKTQAD